MAATAHDYLACGDAKCGSHLCIACQAGYDLGYEDGVKAGYAAGYQAGFAAAVAAGEGRQS